ncbi:hypothetical protein [Constrictibacter sp. MBR-5]|jgi:hypothetical protein|uniref:hypothetical protein n=1 Tax=Constrictibacter sp. MBR-5 TaxID=3156467 RepID=UPI003392DDD2
MRQLPARRLELGRRYRNIFNDLARQIGRAEPAPSEVQMLRRAATLALFCERDEEAVANGDPIDQDNYRRNVAALKQVLVALGLAKKARDVTKADSRFIDQHTAALIDAD